MSTLLKSLLATFNKSKKVKPSQPKAIKEVTVSPQSSKSEAVKQAESTAKEVLAFAREQADKIRETARVEMQALQNTLRSQEDKLKRVEDDLAKKDSQVSARLAEIEATKAEMAELRIKQVEKLEKIGGLTKEKAKDILLEAVDKKLARDVAERIRIAEDEIKEGVEEKAQGLLIDAMYHGSTEYVAEFTISTVKIADDDVKGRIIGKEGRNIRTFEKVTGCRHRYGRDSGRSETVLLRRRQSRSGPCRS